jgi:hypothetical protein
MEVGRERLLERVNGIQATARSAERVIEAADTIEWNGFETACEPCVREALVLLLVLGERCDARLFETLLAKVALGFRHGCAECNRRFLDAVL